MKITYTIRTGQGDLETLLKSDLKVKSTVIIKYREPIDTPCYKKVEGEKYVELTNVAERYQCQTSDCYKKVDGKYVKMTKDNLEVSKCISGDFKCYEYSEDTYYKLLKNPEGISKCYTEDGEYFERATYKADSDNILEKTKTVVSKSENKLEYTSESNKVSSIETNSLIYQFDITNNESSTMYIEALDYEDITGGIIKKSQYSKVLLTLPTNRKFSDNRFYYVIDAGKTITIKVEVKYLLTSDISKKGTKTLNLNIPIVVK
jgi:hypothetical protein